MFCRRCSAGMHFLHNVLPQGRVTGSCRGYEHCGHCASLTICRASLEASRGAFSGVTSRVEVSVTLDRGRRGKGVLLRGMEDINHRSCRMVRWTVLLERPLVVGRSRPTASRYLEMKPPFAALLVYFQKLYVCEDLGRSCRCLKCGIRLSSRLVSVLKSQDRPCTQGNENELQQLQRRREDWNVKVSSKLK